MGTKENSGQPGTHPDNTLGILSAYDYEVAASGALRIKQKDGQIVSRYFLRA